MSASAKLVILDGNHDARFAHTVRQDDLAELVNLSQQFSEARAAWEKKRDWIKAALNSGAGVEPGVLSAEVKKCKGGGYSVDVYEYEMVAVR